MHAPITFSPKEKILYQTLVYVCVCVCVSQLLAESTSGNETMCMCSYQLASTHHICTSMHTFPHSCKLTLTLAYTQPFRKSSGSWKRHLLLSRQPRSRGGTNKCSRASKLQWRRPSLEVVQQYNWVGQVYCTVWGVQLHSTFVAVPGRNQTLFRCVFRSCLKLCSAELPLRGANMHFVNVSSIHEFKQRV